MKKHWKNILPVLFVAGVLCAAWTVVDKILSANEPIVGSVPTQVVPSMSGLPTFSPRSLRHSYSSNARVAPAAALPLAESAATSSMGRLHTSSSATTRSYGTMAYSYTESGQRSGAATQAAAAGPSCCFLAISSTRRLAQGGGQTAAVESMAEVVGAPGGGPRCAPGPPTLTEDDKQLGYEAPLSGMLWLLLPAALYAIRLRRRHNGIKI